jgi:hypothetical protein
VEVSSVLVSGIVIFVGSALFLCAAFTPISFRVFPEKSATRKLEIIRASPTAWSVTQVLFGLGALVTAIGVGLSGSRPTCQPAAERVRPAVLTILGSSGSLRKSRAAPGWAATRQEATPPLLRTLRSSYLSTVSCTCTLPPPHWPKPPGPKSVTTLAAIPLAQSTGGVPELPAIFTILARVLARPCDRPAGRRLRWRHDCQQLADSDEARRFPGLHHRRRRQGPDRRAAIHHVPHAAGVGRPTVGVAGGNDLLHEFPDSGPIRSDDIGSPFRHPDSCARPSTVCLRPVPVV